MNVKMIFLVSLVSSSCLAASKKSNLQFSELSSEWQAALCKDKPKGFRAFVISGATHAPERGGWELSALSGDTPDLIACPYYMTIDAVDGKGIMRVFQFADGKSCEAAVAQLKHATKEVPQVVVIDKDCTAHSAAR